jgi:hypothetical protein
MMHIGLDDKSAHKGLLFDVIYDYDYDGTTPLVYIDEITVEGSTENLYNVLSSAIEAIETDLKQRIKENYETICNCN